MIMTPGPIPHKIDDFKITKPGPGQLPIITLVCEVKIDGDLERSMKYQENIIYRGSHSIIIFTLL